jgi:hypothetical protein
MRATDRDDQSTKSNELQVGYRECYTNTNAWDAFIKELKDVYSIPVMLTAAEVECLLLKLGQFTSLPPSDGRNRRLERKIHGRTAPLAEPKLAGTRLCHRPA